MGKNKDRAVELHIQKEQVKAEYNKYHPLVTQLSKEYAAAKQGPFLERYDKLKEMIKKCTNGFEQIKRSTIQARKGKSSGMVGAAKALLATDQKLSEQLKIKELYKNYPKSDLKRAIEKMETDIENYKSKTAHIRTGIQELKDQYEASKGHFAKQRYEEMKAMVKALTNSKDI